MPSYSEPETATSPYNFTHLPLRLVRVALSGGSDFFGAIIANSIATVGGTDIHYDKCLANLPSGMLQMTSWNDVRN